MKRTLSIIILFAASADCLQERGHSTISSNNVNDTIALSDLPGDVLLDNVASFVRNYSLDSQRDTFATLNTLNRAFKTVVDDYRPSITVPSEQVTYSMLYRYNASIGFFNNEEWYNVIENPMSSGAFLSTAVAPRVRGICDERNGNYYLEVRTSSIFVTSVSKSANDEHPIVETTGVTNYSENLLYFVVGEFSNGTVVRIRKKTEQSAETICETKLPEEASEWIRCPNSLPDSVQGEGVTLMCAIQNDRYFAVIDKVTTAGAIYDILTQEWKALPIVPLNDAAGTATSYGSNFIVRHDKGRQSHFRLYFTKANSGNKYRIFDLVDEEKWIENFSEEVDISLYPIAHVRSNLLTALGSK